MLKFVFYELIFVILLVIFEDVGLFLDSWVVLLFVIFNCFNIVWSCKLEFMFLFFGLFLIVVFVLFCEFFLLNFKVFFIGVFKIFGVIFMVLKFVDSVFCVGELFKEFFIVLFRIW